jgi:hypothetical protein
MILTGYATGFNRRHQRSGHVFQNRYKSILCQKDAYLQELVRYIHLNPLRAGRCTGVHALPVCMEGKGRILICYWAVRKLGFSMTEVANRLGISVPTLSVAVSKGEGLVSQEGVTFEANI